MLFDLPNHNILYAALAKKDLSYDGRAYVAVTSTGIFCRFGCPARTPKSENCRFFETIGECIEAGFRPCKRCYPLRPVAEANPMIKRLLGALDGAPSWRWSEADIKAIGLDPSTVRRVFKRQFGMTFLDMARHRRLREGFAALQSGQKVIDAQLEAGFDSPSAFRDAFARVLGCAPSALAPGGLLQASWIDTPLGDMFVVSSESHLHLLEFVDRKAVPAELQKLKTASKGSIGIGRPAPTIQAEAELSTYFAGQGAAFATPLAYNGSEFTQRVWAALCTIPAGETRSYSDIARQIGRPSATRAVARANGANQIAIMIPCHRVIGADGALTGYGGGLWRKQKLIEIEQTYNPEQAEFS